MISISEILGARAALASATLAWENRVSPTDKKNLVGWIAEM